MKQWVGNKAEMNGTRGQPLSNCMNWGRLINVCVLTFLAFKENNNAHLIESISGIVSSYLIYNVYEMERRAG